MSDQTLQRVADALAARGETTAAIVARDACSTMSETFGCLSTLERLHLAEKRQASWAWIGGSSKLPATRPTETRPERGGLTRDGGE